MSIVSRTISTPTVREVNLTSITPLSPEISSVTVRVSWTISFTDDLAKNFYNLIVKYKCGNASVWSASTALSANINVITISSIPRNTSCQFSIQPIAVSVPIVTTATSSATFISGMWTINNCLFYSHCKT